MIIHANDSNFKTEVLDKKDTVLVDFFAEWCAPCRALSPIVEDIAKDYNVCKVNVDTSPQLARMYNVQSVPTLVVMKNGRMVSHLVGLADKEQILDILK